MEEIIPKLIREQKVDVIVSKLLQYSSTLTNIQASLLREIKEYKLSILERCVSLKISKLLVESKF